MIVLIPAGAAPAQTTAPKAAGEAVYKQRCVGCHEQTNPRIPPRSTLGQMPAARILSALDFGVMMTLAYPMSRAEREAVAAFLGTGRPAVSFPASAYCADRRVTVSDKPKSAVFISSGYSRFGGMPGNVLLAFAP